MTRKTPCLEWAVSAWAANFVIKVLPSVAPNTATLQTPGSPQPGDKVRNEADRAAIRAYFKSTDGSCGTSPGCASA
jgi:hypothetical protein